MCSTSQCELRSTFPNLRVTNVIRIVTYYTLPPLESPDSSWMTRSQRSRRRDKGLWYTVEIPQVLFRGRDRTTKSCLLINRQLCCLEHYKNVYFRYLRAKLRMYIFAEHNTEVFSFDDKMPKKPLTINCLHLLECCLIFKFRYKDQNNPLLHERQFFSSRTVVS